MPRRTPVDIKTYLEEQKVIDVHKAATLIDDYKLTHSSSGVNRELETKLPSTKSLPVSQGGDVSGNVSHLQD